MKPPDDCAAVLRAVLRDDLVGGRQSAATLARINHLLARGRADALGLSLPCTALDLPFQQPESAMPDNLPIEDAKAALKEAYREWLEEKFSAVGKWTLKGLAAAAFAATVGAVLHLSTK